MSIPKLTWKFVVFSWSDVVVIVGFLAFVITIQGVA